MLAIGRSLLAVFLGILVGSVLIAGIEFSNSLLFPPPAGTDLQDPDQLKAFVTSLPLAAMLIVIVAWLVGTFAGSCLAAWFATRAKLVHALAVGILFLLATVMNLLQIPHPSWMWVAVVLVPLSSFLGGRLVAGAKQGEKTA